MLDQVTSATRHRLAMARARAMTGNWTAAIHDLHVILDEPILSSSSYDRIAARMLHAELLYLDGQDAESFAILEELIPAASGSDIKPVVEMSVRRNAASVGTSLWDPRAAEEFYDLVDQQRLSGVNLRDTTSVLDAKEAAESGKHYDSLPALWAEYERTFRQGCWPIWRWAARNLAVECMQVGFLTDAARFAILALDDKCSQRVGELLLRRGDKAEIESVVKWIMGNIFLWRPTTVACSLIGAIADGIPPVQVHAIFEWVLQSCRRPSTDRFDDSRIAKAWDAMEAIAPLLGPMEASEICDVAMSHSFWQEFNVHRDTLRHVIGHCAHLLPQETLLRLLENLADQAVAPSKTEEDVVITTRLIAHIVGYCDTATKERIAKKLYPKDAKVPCAVALLAKELTSTNPFAKSWDGWAEGIIHNLRYQVQIVAADEKPTPVTNSIMQYTQTRENAPSTLVHVQSSLPIQTAFSQRTNLSDETFAQLIEAMIDGVKNSDNLITNRIQLIQLLAKAAEHFDESQRTYIYTQLRPIATGRIKVTLEEMSEAEADHPLNRHSFKGGTLAEVQAVAIETLTAIECAHPGAFTRGLNAIIMRGLQSASPVVRQFAMHAWSKLPKPGMDAKVLVLLSTNDANAKVAAMALEAIAVASGVPLSGREVAGVVHTCIAAARSSDHRLRMSAAYSLGKIYERVRSDKLKVSICSTLSKLRDDVCASIRRVADEASA